MKKKWFILLAILIHSQVLLAQKIAIKDALTDLQFLNTAFQAGHPTRYQPAGTATLDSIIAQVSTLSTDSLSIGRYEFVLGAALSRIGCVHTYIQHQPHHPKTGPYFPLQLQLVDQALRIVAAPDSQLLAQEILSINGLPTNALVPHFLQYRPSDGGTTAFGRAYFNLRSIALVSQFFDYPNAYTVETTQGRMTLAAVAAPAAKKTIPAATTPTLLSNRKNTLKRLKHVAVLDIRSFHHSDKRFFAAVFRYLRTAEATPLVIDLRGNTGGSRKAAVALTRQLVDTPFQYQLLDPKLPTRSYLNAQGRFLLSLSRFKYQVMACYRKRKTADGPAFVYRYQPARHRFKGQIYVLTDGFTASAATMVTAWLKQFTSAIFLGQQAAGGYNGNNGGAFPSLTLPQSQIRIQFPAYRLILDPNSSNRAGIQPDFEIQSMKLEQIIDQFIPH